MKAWIWLGVFALALAPVVFVGDLYLLRLATTFAMYSVLAMAWNLIGGLAGYPSFATAAFFGLGAYTSAIAQTFDISMLGGWLLAGALSAICAAILGLPLLRLKGHYFAIVTLTLTEIIRELINASVEITGGGNGMNLPALGMSPVTQARFFYGAMLGLAVWTIAVSILVHQGRIGLTLRCIAQNENAAAVLGANPVSYKTLAFALSAAFSGFAGGIYGNWLQYIEPTDVFDVLLSIKPLVMALLGGMGTLFGPVVGALGFLALEEIVWTYFLSVHSILLGILIVGLVLLAPDGLGSAIGHLRRGGNRQK